MVRLGAVRSRTDDGFEARALGAETPDLGVDGEAELVLGRMRFEQVAHVGERGGCDRGRGLDAGDFAVVLDGPERLDQTRGRNQLLHEREMGARHRPLVGPTHRVGFEPES